MVFVAPGFTYNDTDFQANSTANSSNLHTMIEGAVFTSISLGEIALAAHVVQVKAIPPTAHQGDGSLWFDETLNLFRVRQEAEFNAPPHHAFLFNNTGGFIEQGAVITSDGGNNFRIAAVATLGWPEVYGVATATIFNATYGLVQKFGWVRTLLEGPITRGDVLVGSNSTGYAKSATFISGSLNITMGVLFGQAFVNVGVGATALATCLVTR